MEEKNIANAYSASIAVQGLNHVDNFDPSQFLITSSKEGETRQYLETQMRTLWFRLAHPEGQVRSTIIQLTDMMAVVEARVYLDRSDPAEDFIANATAQRFASDDPTFGTKFLETAETVAAGRALGRAGFGTQFCIAPGEGEDGVVDTPQGIPGSTAQMLTGQGPQSHPQTGGLPPAGTEDSAATTPPAAGRQPSPAPGQQQPPIKDPASHLEAKPAGQLLEGADALTRLKFMDASTHDPSRIGVACKGAEDHIKEKIGCPAGANTFVLHQSRHKPTINSAVGILDQLL